MTDAATSGVSLPPTLFPSLPQRVSGSQRLGAAVVAAAALTLLCIAAGLTPDPRGVETHTQLGLWPCGWYLASGTPCPTCGMTTAFAAAANRSFFSSLRTQPFGFAAALVTAVLFWAGLHVAVFGSRAGSIAGKLLAPRFVVAAAVLLIGAWVYKMAAMKGV